MVRVEGAARRPLSRFVAAKSSSRNVYLGAHATVLRGVKCSAARDAGVVLVKALSKNCNAEVRRGATFA